VTRYSTPYVPAAANWHRNRVSHPMSSYIKGRSPVYYF
jgi:hypothetical protein